jgi:hypothetical protein
MKNQGGTRGLACGQANPGHAPRGCKPQPTAVTVGLGGIPTPRLRLAEWDPTYRSPVGSARLGLHCIGHVREELLRPRRSDFNPCNHSVAAAANQSTRNDPLG